MKNSAYEKGAADALKKYRVSVKPREPAAAELPTLKSPDVGWGERKTPPAKLSK